MREPRTVAELKAEAAACGRTVRYVLDNTEDSFEGSALSDANAAAYFAIKAAHWANIALEHERVTLAPTRALVNNREQERIRLMLLPRCKHRHVTENVLGEKKYGDECGGRIKRKTRAGQLVGFECQKCFRFAPWTDPAQEQQKSPTTQTESEPAA